MMNTTVLCQERTPAADLLHTPAVSRALAERIVNIAGLSTGDRVLFLRDTGAAIKAAVSDTGARILSAADTFNGDTWKEFRFLRHSPVDAVMGAAEFSRQALPAEWLSTSRRHLRPGGRLVVWVNPDRCYDSLRASERIQRQIRAAGFTSIISGSMPIALGEVVVATGVFNYLGIGEDGRQALSR